MEIEATLIVNHEFRKDLDVTDGTTISLSVNSGATVDMLEIYETTALCFVERHMFGKWEILYAIVPLVDLYRNKHD